MVNTVHSYLLFSVHFSLSVTRGYGDISKNNKYMALKMCFNDLKGCGKLKKKLLLILCVGLLLLLCGCGQTGSENRDIKTTLKLNAGPPEPYKMAIQELEIQNLDKALRYLDLVIKDFPNNEEYVYRAHLLKTMIYTDYYSANIRITDALLEGVKDNPFLELDESKQILDSTQAIINEIDIYKQPFLESTMYIYGHYEKYKNIDFSLHYSYTDNSTEALNDVDWFRQCGTPMPSEDQISTALRDARVYLFGLSFDELIKNNKIDYPGYFYAIGGVASEWDIDLAKKLVQKIIEITKDDKYNKYRIDAEDVLNERFK